MIDIDIQQQLREQYNPDGSQLRLLQLRILDILKEFDINEQTGLTENQVDANRRVYGANVIDKAKQKKD